MYRKHRDALSLVALITGGLIVLGSLGLAVSGGAILWLNNNYCDPEGYISSEWVSLQTDSHALVQGSVERGMELDVPSHVWRQNYPNPVRIKLSVRGDNASEYFIGIASKSDALSYLAGVSYDELSNSCLSSRRGVESNEIMYISHEGGAPQAPLNQSFWLQSVSGSGTQIIELSPEPGEYYAVLMNLDGSEGVNAEVKLGAEIPGLVPLGNNLLIGGFLGLAVGSLIIYYVMVHYRRSNPKGEAVVPKADLVQARWGERVLAYIIDLAVLSILVSWMSWPGCSYIPHSIGSGIPHWAPYSDFGFRNLIYFIYWMVLEGMYGQSIGKKIIGVKVVQPDGRPAGLVKAAIESIGKAFLAPIDLVAGLILYRDERLFSRLSGTIVVKVKRRHLERVEAQSQ